MLRNLRSCSLILALVLAPVPPAFAANGSLKVTSFPSGAEVWVDGTFSGRLTPMSISLAEGDHTVRVQIPNSGWNPDQRIVTIVPGNNDLSVTLLPALTTGPQGPKGDKGDKGDRGEKGDTGATGAKGDPGEQGIPGERGDRGERGIAGNVALAGQVCPTGTFVRGFNASGQVLCGAPGGGTDAPPPPPEWTPIPLPQAGAIETYLRNLAGTEGSQRVTFDQITFPGITLNSYVDILGFAFCDPPDHAALPAATPPIFGCLPEVHVNFAATGPSEATLTIDVPKAFGRANGLWDLDTIFLDDSGPIDGHVLFTGLRVQFHVALVDADAGLKTFGPATVLGISYQSVSHDLNLGDSRLAEFAEFLVPVVENSVISTFAEIVRDTMGSFAGDSLGAFPPFPLNP